MAKGMVIIDEDRCKGCVLCVTVCPVHILQLAGGRFNAKGYRPIEVTDMEACTGCAMCATICPDVVFTVYRQKRKPVRQPFTSTGLSASDVAQACTERSQSDKAQGKPRRVIALA